LRIEEAAVLAQASAGTLNIDVLKSSRELKLDKTPVMDALQSLKAKGVITCTEMRYDFKNTKISTGLDGVNRVFLPSSNIFPTLVASDSNDYVALKDISATTADEFKRAFMEEIYRKKQSRKKPKKRLAKCRAFPRISPCPIPARGG